MIKKKKDPIGGIIYTNKLNTWISLFRAPFQIVGILPFIVGSLLPLSVSRGFDAPVFWWGLLAVVLVMSSTYFNGEVHDIKEDQLSVKLEKNRFSAGTQVLVNGLISPHKVNLVSYLTVGAALLVGLILQFYYRTGFWTIPLGITGIITGFYYSKPPFRWVQRGLGEIFIGYSYGWLPVAVGAYLQTEHIDPRIHWVSLPIICSVFNVILINEFPDYPADIQVNKRNLVVRLGKARCAIIYVIVALMGTITFYMSLAQILPKTTGLFYLPFAALSCVTIFMMLAGKFNDHKLLERMCLITYLVNIGTCFSYITGLLLRA
ncbi:MAG: prenyltransferase [Desulfamplus sp.]|nr:prenyltransferase [Desulfamplus sp.]